MDKASIPRSKANSGVAVILAAVLVAATYALFAGFPGSPPIGRGDRAIDFTLPGIGDGPPLRLADLRGRVVLINFWATWCKPCEDEMPAMERLYRSLPRGGFELVAISVDDGPEPVLAFRDRLGLSFPLLLDPEQKVSGAYAAKQFPETLLVDQNGVVVERYVGAKEWDLPAYRDRIVRLIDRADPS
jgi:peroxiredoxin